MSNILKIQKLKNIIYLNVFTIVIVLCFQATDIKIYDIKLPELIMILILPFLFKGLKIDIFTLSFALVFTFLLVTSLIISSQTVFYLDLSKIGFNKQPYLISISRYIELLSCISFLIFCRKGILHFKSLGFSISFFISKFIRYNSYFGFVYVILIFPILLNLLKIEDSVVYYTQFGYFPRLKGLHFEGGPLGLMFAFIFSLCLITKKGNLFEKTIFISVVALAQSKSGLMLIILCLLMKFFFIFKSGFLNQLVIGIIVLTIGSISLYHIGDLYVKEFKLVQYKMRSHSNDNNLLLGRIPATMSIIPNMVKNNPIFGIGLGNYSLVRNDPRYRDNFPYMEEWDLSGLGGVVTLLAEGGVFFLILLLFIYYRLIIYCKKISTNNMQIGLLFIITLLLGVQLTFIYPWLSLILALEYQE